MMKPYSTHWIILMLLVVLTTIGQAQAPFSCAFDEEHTRLMEDSLYRVGQEQMEQQIRRFIEVGRNQSARLPMQYTIPVVIHIISPPGTAIGEGNNLTDQQIEQGLDLLNESFSNTGAFQTADGHDIGIQFCLAKRTPDGQATNGITRHESELVNDMKCNEPSTNKNSNVPIKQIVNWNCKDYLNIWLVTNLYSDGLGCNLAGFAYYPGAPCTVDGIMQESRYWITVPGTQVTAHEVGHYLSLHHTFHGGCKNDDCSVDGDKVCDTPPDGSQSYAPCNTNSCNTDSPDLPDDNTNYMDYTSCKPLHFTQGQKERMIAGLEIGRSSLLSSLGCQPTLALDAQLQYISDVTASCGADYCPTVRIKNVGANNLTKVSLDIFIDGAKKEKYIWTGNLGFGETETIQLPCYQLGQGMHSSYVQIQSVNNSSDLNPSNDASRVISFEVFGIPTIALDGVDSTRCGNNGTIYVKTDGGTAPYRYRLFPNSTVQSSPIFSNLKNETYTIEVSDANDCKDTLVYEVPDVCPPCLSGIINRYAAVDNICGNTFTVDNIVGFTVGSTVMIYQAQGATVDLTNTAAFGTVTDYGNAGNHEYNVIESINGLDITFRYNLVNSYDVPGNPQVITVPNLANETICNLSCAPWDGRKGGVLVFDADTITMVGNIDVSGKGFRGGKVQRVNTLGIPIIKSYFNADVRTSARKGEGIVVLESPYLQGKGKAANGGGGGNNHNAGGGGGANAGKGGSSGTYIDQSIQTIAIGGATASKSNKVFFGGGGGAGHDNNWKGTSGTNGGGIIIMRNKQLYADIPVLIQSNGLDAATAGIDGAGGGGGGGSMLIEALDLSNKIELKAGGGKGGDNHSNYNNQCHGTGGGGGGGVVYSNLPLTNFNVQGGSRGLLINNYNASACANQPPGGYATAGEDGKFENSLTLNVADVLFVAPSFTFVDTALLCSGEVQVLASADKGSVPDIQFELMGGKQVDDSTFVVSKTGWYTLSLLSNCTRMDTLLYLETNAPLQLETNGITPRNCTSLGNISVQGKDGIPPYSYRINNGAWSSKSVFNDLEPGTYTVAVKDAHNCERSIEIIISDQSAELKVQIDSSDLKVDCTDKETYIALSTTGSEPFHFYSLDGGEEVSNPYFYGLSVGMHQVVSKDEFGCVSDILNFEVIDKSAHSLQEDKVSICEGDTYKVANSSYTQTGIYVDSLLSVIGCDSVIQTQLDVLLHSTFDFQQEICEHADYDFYGTIVNAPGTYQHTLQAANGCDSTVSMTLQHIPKNMVTNPVAICEGKSYTIGSSEYDKVGSYTDTLVSYQNCDSIVVTTLSFLQNFEIEQEIVLCPGESYSIGNSNYSNSGTYRDTLQTIQACDSVIITKLSVLPPAVGEIEVELCHGESYDSGQEIYDVSGEYTEKRQAQSGCDSTLTIRLNILEQSTSSTSYTLCEGDTLVVDGVSYTEFGSFENILMDLNGCDSLAYVDIRREDIQYCDSLNCAAYIPNVFTPDGNGINDVFEVHNGYIEIIDFTIYDRWGNKVYRTGPKQAVQWDGTYKGRQAMTGVYTYFLTGRCRLGKPIKQVGNITLMR